MIAWTVLLIEGAVFGAGVSVGAVIGMIGALKVVAWLDRKGMRWPPKG